MGERVATLRAPFNRYVPLTLISLVLSLYFGAKVLYEEIYPCAFVDRQYCDFASTEYHNLFGWEF